jgi:hypothetical protein
LLHFSCFYSRKAFEGAGGALLECTELASRLADEAVLGLDEGHLKIFIAPSR